MPLGRLLTQSGMHRRRLFLGQEAGGQWLLPQLIKTGAGLSVVRLHLEQALQAADLILVAAYDQAQ